jgi:hypothetical protein
VCVLYIPQGLPQADPPALRAVSLPERALLQGRLVPLAEEEEQVPLAEEDEEQAPLPEEEEGEVPLPDGEHEGRPRTNSSSCEEVARAQRGP